MSKTVLMLGGSGFVGRHLANRLVEASYRIVVPTRRREAAKHLILLPTVDVVEADIHDRAVLERLTRRADAVINLVGILNETRRGDFERAHVALAASLVAACESAGVSRLLHMSALNAGPAAPSRYLRSKGEAEEIVANSGLAWTIFQPSVVFGPEDSFLNMFAMLERTLPVIALASPDARFQPVYVGDVARAFAAALSHEITVRQRFPLCGPKVYSLREIVAYVGGVSGHDRPIAPLGRGLSRLAASVLERLPGKLMSRDNLASMEVPNVCACPFPGFAGVLPTALEAVAPEYLSPDAFRSAYDVYRTQSGR